MKKQQTFNYLAPSEIVLDKDLVNIQIAIALKSCETIKDVTELLDDVRLHERLIIEGVIKTNE